MNPLDTVLSLVTDPIGGIVTTFGARIFGDVFAQPTIKDPIERARMWTLYGPAAVQAAERSRR